MWSSEKYIRLCNILRFKDMNLIDAITTYVANLANIVDLQYKSL